MPFHVLLNFYQLFYKKSRKKNFYKKVEKHVEDLWKFGRTHKYCCVLPNFYPCTVSINARNVRLYYPYWQYTDLFRNLEIQGSQPKDLELHFSQLVPV